MKRSLKLFAALSDETRLRIALLLMKGELCVCELTDILGMEQSRISHGLKVLNAAGLADKRRMGKWIIYSIPPDLNKSGLLKSIQKETPLSPADEAALARCKKTGIREQCK